MPEVVISIDQGTSSTKAIAVGHDGQILREAKASIGLESPHPGWVQQDAGEIMDSVRAVVADLIDGTGHEVVAVGLSNQRESALAWRRSTGEPVGPMLGWQDRRTVELMSQLDVDGFADMVRSRSGLPLDPMFSALKWRWLLDNVAEVRELADRGDLVLGTVDAWIRMNMTGELGVEMGNASRTQLLNIETGQWDGELAERFGIPLELLPPVVDSDHHSVIRADFHEALKDVPLAGVLGDSHSALFGHGIRTSGSVKVTYGTGSSVMGLGQTGEDTHGMVSTIAWCLGGRPEHAVEGNILATGASVQWLSEVFGVSAAVLAEEANALEDTHGLVMVPAFNGLAAPWWDSRAQGVFVGLDQGQRRAHFARAAFNAITYQIADAVDAASAAIGQPIEAIMADGGPLIEPWLMQMQADVYGGSVRPASIPVLSALGAAHLAGLSVGFWNDEDLMRNRGEGETYTATTTPELRAAMRRPWKEALDLARSTPTERKETE